MKGIDRNDPGFTAYLTRKGLCQPPTWADWNEFSMFQRSLYTRYEEIIREIAEEKKKKDEHSIEVEK